jgi:hypothetical protein
LKNELKLHLKNHNIEERTETTVKNHNNTEELIETTFKKSQYWKTNWNYSKKITTILKNELKLHLKNHNIEERTETTVKKNHNNTEERIKFWEFFPIIVSICPSFQFLSNKAENVRRK